ncbi:two-component sensor histidine kinase [Leptospira perolatii]|uniref:histidine kinase n=1 Tax=Leptospira perolatii TaxID=2023191 RepID=A0A2M9ZQ74_9LEPT|nr:sensor histidine kinase KdpD [Leptospira perolatii]PJZ68306.1 two-component sensor histidine kinase [Leptospira perolatii]PJZ74227.1 two-component sensor histidine kinase [Leptospira perolatii]
MGREQENRPDPDELLSRIQSEEENSKKGKLKIFFGMAPGVGKTYEMLKDAQRIKSEGKDLVIGYLEGHDRKETLLQAEGLEVVPRQKIRYKEIEMEEMDLDAVIARKPEVVLIDELAHTNVPGSRHLKRYQDVLEILDQGIDVYSTLNVQHLESRAKIVEEMIGAPVSERIPDSILEIADEVELIDFIPEDLVKRLKEGRIYKLEKVPQALSSFFRIPHLTALREISLNYTSKLVDRELSRLEPNKDSKLSEKILVAVSPSPHSADLIREAKKIAFGWKCTWVALYVDDGRRLSNEERKGLHSYLQLARELGAEILTLPERDPVVGILRAAQRTKATHVVIGKTSKTKFSWILEGGSVADRLSKGSEDFQLIIASTKSPEDKRKTIGPFWSVARSSPLQYFLSLVALLGVTALNLLLAPFTGYWSIGLLYLFYVMGCALFAGRGPVLVSSAISALLWNFLFIPPRFTFRIAKLEDWLMFVTYFILALVLGILTTRLRSREEALRSGEETLSALYDLSLALSRTQTEDGIAAVAVAAVEKKFKSGTMIVLTDSEGRLQLTPHKRSQFLPDQREFALAAWTFQNRKPSGRSTDTVPSSRGLYLPLLSPGGCFGVLGLDREGKEPLLVGEDAQLNSMLNQIALSLERSQLLGLMESAKVIEESEKLHSALFNSISHEFRTPLTVIRASLDLLEKSESKTEKEAGNTKLNLVGEIRSAYRKLERLVNNLLDMSRLESGRLKLDLQWEDPGEIVMNAIKEYEVEWGEHPIKTSIDENLPLVRLDNRLMQQVLIHLIQNACMHTPDGTQITIRASVPIDHLLLTVEDDGPGIPVGQEEKIFEKFSKASQLSHGTGLGLSICRGLVEAQGGTISGQNKPEGGARFTIRIPVITFPPLNEVE